MTNNKKLQTFRMKLEDIEQLRTLSRKYECTQISLIEAALDRYFRYMDSSNQ